MLEVKKAIYAAVTGDAPLMARLGNQGPYTFRLPSTAKVTATQAAIVVEGEYVLDPGAKEDQTYTLTINSLSHDLVENVAADLMRLFHAASPFKFWRKLSLSDGSVAFIRNEGALDLPDPDSEWVRKTMRFRVRYAKKFP